ncbi:MAG TPA: DUF4159 domain-containing protein [Azospirillaceae bacterium]|nr:DUF4159 domain-containing protein [Azospirillaceae bacterium]
MLALGPLAFTTPWLLAALVALPVIWWLLRVTPPSPQRVRFPAIRLLFDLDRKEETPARTPWWLLLLRLVLAGLVILALAGPLLNPNAAMPGSGPVVLVVDNGWAAGRDWPARQQAMLDVVDQAGRAGREVVLLPTAPSASGDAPTASGLMRAADARRAVQLLEPHPWPTARAAAVDAVRGLSLRGSAHAVWLSDGLADPSVAGQRPDQTANAARTLAEALQRLGSLEVRVEPAPRLPMILLPPATEGSDFVARLVRTAAGPAEPAAVQVSAADGRMLAREPMPFAQGAKTAEARIRLPSELRNEAAAIRIENETTVGATVLIDERWRRRPVGLVSGRPEQESQPLLSDLHYLERALSPYSEVRRGSIQQLLQNDLSVLILSDVGALSGPEAEGIGRWVEKGGVVVRFAGPRLAQNADQLVPVRLRQGDRRLGGALSWEQPAKLAPFPELGPFAGLPVAPDVEVARQVLAEPAPDLGERTWAQLADGTPLVTGAKRGDGWVVLVHTTANPDWSNLPLSGLYVEMLRRLTGLSAGVAGALRGVVLAPVEVLDGMGRLVSPPPTAYPLSQGGAEAPPTVGPHHPPGFYGTTDARQALNLTAGLTDIAPLPPLPPGVTLTGYAGAGEVDLLPWLLGAAMGLAMLDLIIALLLRGLLPTPARRSGGLSGARRATAASLVPAALAIGVALLAASPGARAQSLDEREAVAVTSETHLAYVITGDREQDTLSKAGLDGLSGVLARRTSIEAQEAKAVDPEVDELAFYALIYWPMTSAQQPLSPVAQERINTFLRNGGTILFDTRDAQFGGVGGTGPGSQALRLVTLGLDIPPLAPVPPDHVLSKAFYLMQEFPGRYAGGEVWLEAQENGSNDGVSSVVVGANDWAAAWAMDEAGRPLAAVVPGGERQREMAYRFGVNLVMYVLTGNYKTDQVHVPAILERLGQ